MGNEEASLLAVAHYNFEPKVVVTDGKEGGCRGVF
jgi:hypothetical protein